MYNSFVHYTTIINRAQNIVSERIHVLFKELQYTLYNSSERI